MDNYPDIFKKVLDLKRSGAKFALATVIQSAGSTPQKAGAKAIFTPAGEIWGTLGGGCLEAESRKRALRALDEGKSAAFDLRLDEIYGWDDGLICGGKVRVFADPSAGRNEEAYRAMLESLERRQPGLLLTNIAQDGATRWVPADALESAPAELDREALAEFLRKERAGTLTGEANGAPYEWYVEPLTVAPELIIAGGGHVGQATCRLAAFAGFEVTVIDDRPAFANASNTPDAARTICGDIAKETAAIDIGPDTYIVIVTRGHRHDGDVLAACIHSKAAFIGMIGSRRKAALIRKSFIEDGTAAEADFARVRSPIGLDIGSVTVHEIAMSIVAQLVAVRRKAADAHTSPVPSPASESAA